MNQQLDTICFTADILLLQLRVTTVKNDNTLLIFCLKTVNF